MCGCGSRGSCNSSLPNGGPAQILAVREAEVPTWGKTVCHTPKYKLQERTVHTLPPFPLPLLPSGLQAAAPTLVKTPRSLEHQLVPSLVVGPDMQKRPKHYAPYLELYLSTGSEALTSQPSLEKPLVSLPPLSISAFSQPGVRYTAPDTVRTCGFQSARHSSWHLVLY